ncbi:protein O-glucosyltransferase 2 isoform X4 [Ranitomeya imitator]|uniref:protein O-glucosyltransferase 2 isoform X4 n=1 Tax=Ranitomeya imitator TaxID=111125 RepID=UPI0037E77A6A
MFWQLLLVAAIAAPLRCTESPPAVSAELSGVWGPGLRGEAALPARYFYIQAADTQGNNFTSTPQNDHYQVHITALGEQYTRVGVQLLDRKDGSFLVRYKLYASYSALQIEVQVNGRHVAKSPYFLKGPIYSEECHCPELDSDMWLRHMSCKDAIPQIQRDLKHFPTVDPDKIAVEIPERFGDRQSLCHYTIKDNKIYIKTYGEHVGFRIFMDSLLLSLTSKVKLPDIEFFVNLGDWPLEKQKVSPFHPIFSWCGSLETKDIVMPTYDLTDSILETMGRVSLDMMSVQANTGPKWEEKNNTAFWRGRDSCKERLELVKLGRKHPDMIDAAFTHFFFFKHDENVHGPIVQPIPFFDFFKAKKIAETSQEFARNNLMGDHVFCYYFKLFQEKITIPFGDKYLDAILSLPRDCSGVRYGVLLTHGAGGDMNFSHLVSLASYLASHGLLCLRFTCKGLNLVYRTKAYHAVLEQANWQDIISQIQKIKPRHTPKKAYVKSHEEYRVAGAFLAGRSMGSRAATSLMRTASEQDDSFIQGLICLSYPLHPPKAKSKLRDEDLLLITKPALFISGSADEMCDKTLMTNLVRKIKAPVKIHWVENANHGLTAKGKTLEDVLSDVNEQTLVWIQQTLKSEMA